MNRCTTTAIECNNPTDQYICDQCVSDLQKWIDLIPGYLEELPDAIYRLDNVRQKAPDGAGGGGTGAPDAPINLDAYQIRLHLLTVEPKAKAYANDERAAKLAETIIGWVKSAELILSGPEPEYVDHQRIREKVEYVAPPMPTRTLVPWLRENARISITGKDIRNWAHRGKIRPVKRYPSPTYWPHEVIQVHRETRENEK